MKNQLSLDDAQQFAIDALVFLAQDSELLSRFLALTGISADQIRTAAGEPGFLAGVLQFYLGHEPTLMKFCETTGTDPASFQAALRLLPGGRTQEM
ncbi:DUF3572 family protein [Phyllobacterium sp. SYP-B3895]|uniref:DUF3572 domain-containing protein n=1 Tax=Phyllobacterium sp. SYP-B3895 TaxID=2663240 RepID=UPI00129966C9|nr:DUF3572 domain-containing protein [Phyllobacterium sp. SYP-B3895]MRG55602.1 DUF3572 family protein [Phyllobacterium sp. SYP-B3895]